MTKDEMLKLLIEDKYYTIDDLRYNRKIGIMMAKEDFAIFLQAKDRLVEEKSPFVMPLALKSFNSKHFFYVRNLQFLSAYRDYFNNAPEITIL